MADDDLTTREAFEQVTTAALVAVGEVAKQLPAVSSEPGIQALIAVALPGFGLAIGRGLHRMYANRLPTFTTGYAKAFDNNPEKVEAYAQEHKDDPDYHEAMLKAFRAMMDAAEPEVVETLGYLAGHYNYSGKRPDRFFRALGRLLCELEPGELDQLNTLQKDVVSRVRQYNELSSATVLVVPHSTAPTLEAIQVSMEGDPVAVLPYPPAARRLFALLKREGFATNISVLMEAQSERHRRTDGDGMRINLGTVREMIAILLPDFKL